MIKILITGNKGYIGVQLSKYLKKKYKNKIYIVGFDLNLFEGCEFEKNTNVDRQILGDVRKINKNHIKNIDYVIHLAAISNDPMGNLFEKVTHDINYKASKRLAQICNLIGVKKFIFASSCSVYGLEGKLIKNENSKLAPLTAYAKSKILSEKSFEKIKSKKTEYVSLRFATACGVSDMLRLDLVLNDFVTSAKFKKKIEILSNGKPWRPLITVADMCKAIDWSLFEYKTNKKTSIFNVGSNKWNFQVKDIAYQVKKIFKNVEIKINNNSPNDKRSYKVDFSKYKKLSKNYYPSQDISEEIIKLKKMIKNKNNLHNFRSSKYIRLNHLKNLIKKNKISKNIVWEKNV